MAKIEVIQTVDTSNFKAANAEELQKQIVHYFGEKGCPPTVEIISDNTVKIIFDTDNLEYAEKNFHCCIRQSRHVLDILKLTAF